MENPLVNPPTYSVIVLMYHRTKELVDMARDCIASVRNSIGEDTELIIVDNGSTEVYDWQKECDTYIRLKTNMGCAEGWNTGLRAARGEYMAILGDDTIVHKGFLEGLKKAMHMPDCGVANIHVQNLPAGAGVVECYKWFSGACFMLTRNTINKVGYFSHDYWPVNFEDTDYWIRTYKAGLKLYRNYGVSIQHKEGQTTHSPDLSMHFDRLKIIFMRNHGFDPLPIFYGDAPIESVLK